MPIDVILWLAIFLASSFITFIIVSTHYNRRIKQLKEAGLHWKDKANTAHNENIAYKTRLETITSLQTQNQQLYEKMLKEFQIIAGQNLYNQHSEIQKKSTAQLNEILNPLKNQIEQWKIQLNQQFTIQAKDQGSLMATVKLMSTRSEELISVTTALNTALKKDSKMQGNWGEIILERLLENSGLRKGFEYTTQGTGLRLKNTLGQTEKPDVVIHLPGNSNVIIDSKMSFTAYANYIQNETKNEEKSTQKQKFIQSIKRHVDELSGKAYDRHTVLQSPEFVIMFIPIEGAFSLALTDTALLPSAYQKKIILASPSTLMAMLGIVSSMWRIDLQNKNANKIAQKAGYIYDRFQIVLRYMMKMGTQINILQKEYDTVMQKMTSGKQSLAKPIEELKTLGAKTKPSLNNPLHNTPIQTLTEENQNNKLLDENFKEIL